MRLSAIKCELMTKLYMSLSQSNLSFRFSLVPLNHNETTFCTIHNTLGANQVESPEIKKSIETLAAMPCHDRSSLPRKRKKGKGYKLNQMIYTRQAMTRMMKL
jgi:hypothetical protein